MSVAPHHLLQCHPIGANPYCRSVEASAHFDAEGSLRLSYRVDAAPAGLRLPAMQCSRAQDELWKHTCCEAFVGVVGGTAYREFNFSPSSCWAAYEFADYRQRNLAWSAPLPPQIEVQVLPAGFLLEARLAPALLPEGDAFEIALTTVIESLDGSKTYWALQHASLQPDFHLRQSFQLTLKVTLS